MSDGERARPHASGGEERMASDAMRHAGPASKVETGDPRSDQAAFRRCLGQFGTGVTVITAAADEGPVGMTANSFASVSLDPPLVLWSVKRSSESFRAFEAATHFAVNVLSSDQIALSKNFGRSGDDKFVGVRWKPGIGRAPLLEGALASFECRKVGGFPGGDHLILVGDVERFTRCDRAALLFVQGRYSVAAEYRDATPRGNGAGEPRPRGPMNEFLTALLYRTHGALSAALDEGRKAEGVTVLQSRIMAAIETLPGRTLDSLLPDLFLGSNAAAGALDELVRAGLVTVGRSGELTLSPLGAERNRSLLDRARAIEARELSSIAADDVASCRRVLHAIVDRIRAT